MRWRRWLVMLAPVIPFPQIRRRKWQDKKQWKRVQAQCNLQTITTMQALCVDDFSDCCLSCWMLVSAGRERRWGWRWKPESKGHPLCWRRWRQHHRLHSGFHPHHQTVLRMLKLEGWQRQAHHSRNHQRWIQHSYSICLFSVCGFRSWSLLGEISTSSLLGLTYDCLWSLNYLRASNVHIKWLPMTSALK